MSSESDAESFRAQPRQRSASPGHHDAVVDGDGCEEKNLEKTASCFVCKRDDKASQAVENELDCFQVTVTITKRKIYEPALDAFKSDTTMKVFERLIAASAFKPMRQERQII